MPFRLKVDLEGQVQRFSLDPGVHRIGTAAECAVRIPHDTVSRHHAELRVTETSVFLRDAGSTNGTSVGFRIIRDETPLAVGEACAFGSVEARLEEVAAGDLEAGIALALPDAPPAPSVPGPPTDFTSTLKLSLLDVFTLQRLPTLVQGLVGAEPAEAMQLVGSTLYNSLPTRWVELVRGPRPSGGDRTGVLYRAAGEEDSSSGDDSRGEGEILTEDVTDGVTLRVALMSAKQRDTYEPLIFTAAALLRLALGATPLPPSPARRTQTPPPPPDPPSVVPAVQRLYGQAWRVAEGKVSVLIHGESGTGKEILARYIHRASGRSEARLVTLNCAALPRDLLESELFGVERGVATGVDARPGKFERAHRGTLFLDEIGDMALETQAKILRVLQEREVFRLGGNEPRPADVRVLAATNRDIEAMLDAGSFRRDLYHRIADWVVELPPLRRRKADIANLAAYFLSRECRKRGRYAAGISRAALDALLRYPWPGNIRELEREMARAVLFLEDGALLESQHLQPQITDAPIHAGDTGLKEILEEAERRALVLALADAAGDTAAAAEELKIARSTLYRRMKALGIPS